MTSSVSNRRNTGFKLLLSVACTFVIFAGLKAAQALILPILLGFFLAILSLPLTKWLQRRRVPKALAVVIAVAADLLVLTSLVFITASVMPDFQASAKKYDIELRDFAIERAVAVESWTQERVGWLQHWFAEIFGDEDSEEAPPELFDLKSAVEQILSVNSLVSVINWNTNFLQLVLSMVTKAFFALILMIFILAEADRFGERMGLVAIARGPNFNRFRHTGRQMQRYLRIKTLASIVTGYLAWLSCSLLGVEFAMLWGLIAFFFNYVPTIGSLIAAIPPVLVALLQLGYWQCAAVALCYLTINVAIGNFIEPTLLGRGFGISTTVVIVSVLFWGWLWGPVGMFLAVPLTMMIKMMVEDSEDFGWLAVVIGKEKPKPDETEQKG